MLLPKQNFPRRPSNPVTAAITISLVFIVLLLQARQSSIANNTSGKDLSVESSKLIQDVFNKTLGFEKIFVINLPERTDRRDATILSAALTNIDVDIVEAVRGDVMLDKAVPNGPKGMKVAEKGCWRSHMNILQDMIRKNISSALILEDDADWDVRIKEQLRDFALSTQALTQPLFDSPSSYADSTYPSPLYASSEPASDFYFNKLPHTIPPKDSPYGDSWDLLWLGHCAMRFPSSKFESTAATIPKGRIVQASDPTVPEKQHLTNVLIFDDLKAEYPDHTRVTHHVKEGVCTAGYAITQAGARKLLRSVGLHDVNLPYDQMLYQFCDGFRGQTYHECLATQPAIFQPHRAAGSSDADSDIQGIGGSYNRVIGMTHTVRWSTRLNWDVLIAGGKEFVDQYPDTQLIG